MENIGIENLAQATYEFLGHTELETVFSNNFDEVDAALLAFGLSEEQAEIITGMFIGNNHDAFTRGFKSACAVNFMVGGVAQ